MSKIVRAFRYLRYLRSRERILPMPEGNLLDRCASLCGWITSKPGSALR